MLEIHSLHKMYPRAEGPVHALNGVSLGVSAGEFVTVQGPSGCGKTTLLLAAGGLLQPNGGEVMLDGQDPYGLSPEGRAVFRAEKIGFVFQQYHLLPYLSVLDNVLLPCLARAVPDARRHAEELIERFGLTDRQHHTPAELSSGECQRTALARAILTCPKLLLADEPTGNLDERNAAAVLGYMAEFTKAGGAVLLVTHDAQAAAYAQRTLRLVNGNLSKA